MDLCEALRKALGRVEIESLEDVFRRYSIRELALKWLGLEWVPGVTSKRRDYLDARRLFERYRAGAGMGPRGGKQTRAPKDLEDFLDSLRERFRPPAGPLTIGIKGDVQISKDRKRRRIPTSGGIEIPADCVQNILDALDDDDCDAAEELFSECFAEAGEIYSVPIWHDVDELTAS